jgi:signal peptidase I
LLLNTLIGNTKKIQTTGDILIIKAEKLYRSDRQLPEVQNPIFNKKKIYKELMYKDVGHPDLLNDYWANLAIKSQLWRGITIPRERKKFKDWKLDKNNNYRKKLEKKRKEYRKFINQETINFIL